MSVPGGIVVLDFGGQYTQLIARRIREQEVFSAVLPCTASLDDIRRYQPSGLILSGGPSSVYADDAPACDAQVLHLGLPVLGICYGMQWMTRTLGGEVLPAERREYGPAQLAIENESRLFTGIPRALKVWNSHGDHVAGLPPGFHVTARTANAIAAFEDSQKRLFAVEFHPEVQHTANGTDILRNFAFAICGAQKNWSRAGFIA
jgi:GMP synthase (glutamine-hydrolysing)